MPLSNRRTVYYLGAAAATTVAFTVLYNVGMAVWEGRPQPWFRSLEVVFQTFTTTGYGEDAPWTTPQMNLLVITMQLSGIGLILAAVDVFVVPWMRDALTASPPTGPVDQSDHVVLCGYSDRGATFVTELESRDEEYAVVEPDDETALDLHRADRSVVHGDPETIETLERAGIGPARAVVADADDDVNASVVLSAREANPDVRIVTFVEDRELAEYHHIAGADEVLSPRQLLGESLAQRVPDPVTANADEGVEIGDDFELAELPIQPGSDCEGVTFGDARIRERTGASVIGAWIDGEFRTPVDPSTTLAARTSLLVAGRPDQLERLRELTAAEMRPVGSRTVVVAGMGRAGSAAVDWLSGSGTSLTVLDREDKPGVDVVGDAREPDALAEAGIDDASTLLLTVGDDTTAVFATLVARDRTPDLRILVRANDDDSVPKLYRAGADYVQSIDRVSGRMLASTVFEDETVLAYDVGIEIVRRPAGGLAGRTLAGADVHSETGCTVVAVERDGETRTELDPREFRFRADDTVVVVGTDEQINEFERRFGG